MIDKPPSCVRIQLLLPLLVAVVSFGVRLAILLHADFMFDDPYITWRVARNLASGLGAVYNVADHVQASSSLLHTWFCAALWWLFEAHAIFIDRLLACIADACCTFLIARTVMRLKDRLPGIDGAIGAAAGALFHALSAQAAFVAPAGLETSFYSCAVLFSCLHAGRRQWWAASFVGCLAVLLRPDGCIAFAIVCLLAWGHRAIKPVLVVCAVVLLPALVAQWLYYGTVVPQTITAKSLIERSAQEQWMTLLNEFFTGGLRQFAVSALVVCGSVFGWKRGEVRPLLIWLVGYAAAFSTFASWWPWYWSPLTVAVGTVLGLGVAQLSRLLSQVRLSRGMGLAAISLGCLGICISLSQHTYRRALWGRAVLAPIKRQNLAMARWVEMQTPSTASVLTERMGEFGFHVSRRIDDYPGLVSRGVTDALRTLKRPIAWGPSDAAALNVILQQVAPTHLLLRRAEYDGAVRAGILHRYRVVHAFPAESAHSAIADYQDMLALERDCCP